MKKAITIIITAVFFILAIVVIAMLRREEPMEEKLQFNLSRPERQTVKIDGKVYSFLLSRYDPPYVHTRLLASREEQDLSTPEGTDLALWSAVGRGRDWYLSLFDEGAQENLLKRDQRAEGRILEEYSKGKPLPTNLQKTGNYSKFIYKVEIEFQGKKYAITHQKNVFEGKVEEHPSTRTFVKQGDIWLVTDDLREHPVRRLVGLNTYEELREILKKGSWKLR